ncbi:MAG: outer membrane lipid asymmetry maintenance protein MlaD [Alphaproteobacteria bacterium]|nr:outer membrane lipid asymmetry maintenance protein MlaD [Alphaproteobacteria bacterium]
MGKHIFETVIGAIVLIVAAAFLYFAYNSTHVSKSGGYLLVAKFQKADGIVVGTDVRISGIKVGSVTKQELETSSFLAKIWMSVDKSIKVPDDSSAEIVSDGLLGGKYINLVPGAEDSFLKSGGEIRYTQSAVNLETLIGKYIFGGTKKDEDKSDKADKSGESSNDAATKDDNKAGTNDKKNPFATGL